MHVVCPEHLDEAIDAFLDEFGEAPDLYRLGEMTFTAWTPPEHCHFCGEHPEYLVV